MARPSKPRVSSKPCGGLPYPATVTVICDHAVRGWSRYLILTTNAGRQARSKTWTYLLPEAMRRNAEGEGTIRG